MGRTNVLIIGLDSIPPRIAFDLFSNEMPCLTRLRNQGTWGPLRSTDPPVTVPAWVSMTSGHNPGQLGIYGFRNQRRGTTDLELVNSKSVAPPRIWDLAFDAGLSSVVVSVPLTYPLPPPRSNTILTSCFLTPGSDRSWISPADKRLELTREFGPYLVDVPNFRTDDKQRLLNGCNKLTSQHFKIFRYLIKADKPDFAMIVDLGPDRLHHGLLGSILPEHPLHDPQGPFVEQCRQYYGRLDREIEKTIQLCDPKVTMVVSDHGVQPLKGAMAVNEWLIEQGYLVLNTTPTKPTPPGELDIDWSRTKALGQGGHHCRICFNVKGREPDGIIEPNELRHEKQRLIQKIKHLDINNEVIVPDQKWPDAKGFPPDLLVYWDQLALRAVGTVGHKKVFLKSNDTGPDEANHAKDGIFVCYQKGATGQGYVDKMKIEQVFEIACDALKLQP